MKICCSIIFLFQVIALDAMGQYQPGDTLYVWALSGLTLRDDPSMQAKKLTSIPYGTLLVVQNFAGEHYTKVEAVPAFKIGAETNPAVVFGGDFAQVEFKGETGYIFDGYLSKLPPLKLRPEQQKGQPPAFEDQIEWATRNFGLLQKTEKGTFEHGLFWSIKWIFGNGILSDSWGEKGGHTRNILPGISMEEAFMLFNFYENYEWRVQHPANYSEHNVLHFNRISEELWYFYDEVCEFTIRFIPGEAMAVISNECSC